MKNLAVNFAFLVLLTVFCEGIEKHSNFPIALENVTSYLFNLETRMFINNFGIKPSTLTWLVLKNLNEKAMPFRLQYLDLDDDKVLLDSSSFLTFDSFKNVQVFNERLEMTNEFFKPLQLFLFCQGAKVSEFESLAADVYRRAAKINYVHQHEEAHVTIDNKNWKIKVTMRLKTEPLDIIQYEYFVIDEELYVKLVTFVWYSPGKCGKLHLIEVNKFSKKSAKWENDNFSIEKLKNFHGCKIDYYTEFDVTGSYFHTLIPKVLEKYLNYKLSYYKYAGQSVDVVHRKACYDSQQNFPLEFNKEENKFKKSKRKSPYFVTHVVGFTPNWIAVPPSEKYSEYEKLKMPFDDYVWALIAFAFLAAFVTIFILYRLRPTTRHFVIESNVTTPSLNVTQIFFGISIHVLPRRNFARFLTMSFILYSLIIRTVWQGKMYEFMQKDIMKPEVQTVKEMIEKGYTFYMEHKYREKFPASEISLRGKIADHPGPRNFSNYFLTLQRSILDPKFKGVMQVEAFTRKKLAHETKGRFAARLRKEILYVSMCGLEFPRHHHFTGIYELKSQQLFTGGIVPHYIDGSAYGNNLLDIMKKEETRYKHLYIRVPKVLDLILLEPGFVIWTSSLSFAIIAFLLELLVTLRNLFVMKSVLVSFYRLKSETRHSDFFKGNSEVALQRNERLEVSKSEKIPESITAKAFPHPLFRADSIDKLLKKYIDA